MSRCFPYPPPGFEKSLPLIESLKLQKGREKAKKERKKEKKREKKEKKEESWGDREKTQAKKHSHRKRHYEESSQSTTHKTGDLIKRREDDSEQLEKSSLTEEQGGPVAVQSLYDSSDSTQNSSKRIKHTSVGFGGPTTTQGNCNGLRIRLPLLRHKETESSISSDRPSFSGRTETVPAQQVKAGVRPRHDPPSSADELPWFSGSQETVPSQQELKATLHHRAPSSIGRPFFSGSNGTTPSEELHRNTDGKPVSVEAGIGRRGSSRSSNDRDTRRLYKKLIVEWNPPSIQAENPEADDDQDWLFGKSGERRRHGQQGETRGEQAAVENEGLGRALCSWPPRACFLPEVGIHALPYVVPF